MDGPVRIIRNILDAIVTLITAPFRALGQLFKGGGGGRRR
jgi:hypothetical protein